MIFSELYSIYYTTVAKIIETAFNPSVTEKELQRCVVEQAFSESVTTILPSLKSGRWKLLNDDLSPVLHHKPTMPLTLLEKRWLKAVADDPKIKLFDIQFPKLDGVKPLFTREDYKIYDKYSDGDPFEDKNYIRNFRFLLSSVKNKNPVKISLINKKGKNVVFYIYPVGFEYSEKDDKIRVTANGCRYRQFNLSRITECCPCSPEDVLQEEAKAEEIRELSMIIKNERNALERVMLHFAHFERQAERLPDGRYLLRMKYYENDETEIVIRVLSFGPYVQVTEPESFVNLIRERLILQKSCGLL